MVVEPEFLDSIQDDSTVLERQPFVRAAESKKMFVHRHIGFWQCMDTHETVMNWSIYGNPEKPMEDMVGLKTPVLFLTYRRFHTAERVLKQFGRPNPIDCILPVTRRIQRM